ncbi:unnamed protein product [Rotaria magnacalcarata]|uniref:AB hydrolase-1 domain-containing protein n=2 Tax=Rotaria magnacalcarata TaxID=392030 RepID=A0A816SG53_9BILA|nr:unnamed protein product [Rotaria magnacalcarata]
MTDAVGLLDYLGINRVHIIGWSNGAIISLNLTMNYLNKVISLFAFAANYIISDVKEIGSSTVFNEYLTRIEIEYAQLNPVSNDQDLFSNLTTMWDADREEAIYRNKLDTMSLWIPQAGELILPRTSHFSFLQDPNTCTATLKQFMAGAMSLKNDQIDLKKAVSAPRRKSVFKDEPF